MTVPTTVDPFLNIVLAPLRLVTDPAERLWWPALLGALTLAVAWEWGVRGRRPSLRRAGAALSHPSCRVDLQLAFVRAAMTVVVLGGVPVAATWLAVQVVLSLWALAGAPPPPLSAGSMMALYTGALFVASDASRYLLHRASHAAPLLWRFHQVHHSAEVLTPLTLYRIHPVEQVLQSVRGVLVLGVVGGVFAWLSRGAAGPLELFGVPAVVLGLNVLGANLRHSHVRLGYPLAVEHLLISPAQHQLHHGPDAQDAGNYGAFLAIWDWVGGTLRCSAEFPAPVEFGLRTADLNHDPTRLGSALMGPLRRH